MNLVWNLGRELVESQRGDEANHAIGNPFCYGYKIRVSKGRASGETVHTSADPLKLPSIPHGVKCLRVDTRTEGLCRSEYAPMLFESGDSPLKSVSSFFCVLLLQDNTTNTYSFI